MGSYDLDLRPPPMQRFTMDSWIEICENCGFVWHDLGDQKIDKNIIREVMTSEQWIFLCSKEEIILSLNFEKYALMCIALAGAKEEALAYKYAAWAADDEFNEVKATAYRIKSVNAFFRAIEDSLSDEHELSKIRAIVADLLRVAGQFEDCVKFSKDSMREVNDENILKVLRFQAQIANLHDANIYKVEDALSGIIRRSS